MLRIAYYFGGLTKHWRKFKASSGRMIIVAVTITARCAQNAKVGGNADTGRGRGQRTHRRVRIAWTGHELATSATAAARISTRLGQTAVVQIVRRVG